jgi:hypothetical protein
LPDGLFSKQKYQFVLILEGLSIENLGIFYDHLIYFTATGNILWSFSILCGDLVYFSPFWYFGPRKIWQPCCKYTTSRSYFQHTPLSSDPAERSPSNCINIQEFYEVAEMQEDN